ncbi:MAG: glycosyltransferase family 4 protein [Fibrobacter sp.]|nr:glycosyltransferase family 4 protein [Fibrobacter sp.]
MSFLNKQSRDTKEMKIVFMNSIGPDVWRGGEKWMVNAASGLLSKGHEVVCIGRKDAIWLRNAEKRGLKTLGFSIHADFDPVIIFKLYRIFSKMKPDILCCNFEKDVRLGGIAARMAGVPVIFVRKGLSLIYDKLRYRLSYRYIVDRIITPASFIKNQFKKFDWLSQDRIHVVHNGVEIEKAASFSKGKLKSSVGIDAGSFCILGAGALFSQKGFEYLIEALSIAGADDKSIHLAIAGSGDQEPFRKLAEQMGVGKRVHFLGHRDDLPELMYSADLFILSSIDEGLPNVVLEAMSAGTPVIAADAGGTSEIIDSGSDGFVVPVKDANALAGKISLLRNNKDLREEMAERALRKIRNSFSIDAMVNNVESVFTESLKQSGRA